MRIFHVLVFILLGLLAHAPAARAQGFEALAGGGAGGWLNVTRPLRVEDMQGRLVLLDFWTYGCINCMQIIPDLTALEEQFGDKLLIIGVHSAKFEGERENARILAAAKRFGLKHPVINDSDYAIWDAFGVRAWPTQILLGPDGEEISRYAGEGHRAEITADLEKALPRATAATPLAGLIAGGADDKPLSYPARLAYAGQSPWGALFFVADSGHNRLLGVDLSGNIKVTIGSSTAGFADGAFAAAQFNHPRGLSVAGNRLYVADTGNHRIREVDLGAWAVTTIAGTGERGSYDTSEHTPARSAGLASPWDVELIDGGKTLAIANAGTHQILAYDIAAKTVSVLAGSGREGIDDGKAHKAALAQPSGLSASGGSLFFADAESSALRILHNGVVKTLIGTGLFDFGLRDGVYPQAMMQHPQGLYADENRVVIADTYNNALRIYDRKAGRLSTLPLAPGTLNEPGDVLVIGDTAYVADTGAHAIRAIDLKTGAARTLL